VKTDRISLLPTLLGKNGQKTYDFFYFEFHELNGQQAVYSPEIGLQKSKQNSGL